MLIPIIPKDTERTDFTCRDGEIDFVMELRGSHPASAPTVSTGNISAGRAGWHPADLLAGWEACHSIIATAGWDACSGIIRIPLRSGDKPKAELMLSGEISRVDPETADRLTQAIVEKAAETLLDLSTDLRRQGLFILPFRVFSMLMMEDGTLSYPTPQAVVLPTDFPPHPEITAASATDDSLTLSIRFPVRPHRLTVTPPTDLPAGLTIRTFISYPLYIPDPKEMRGSIGSVRTATGANATGIRFAFLSKPAIKASVAAPEKYYELVGNDRTGYRLGSKSVALPDYSCYADLYGFVPPFRRESLIAPGEDIDAHTDPLDWIADWHKTSEGYLPASLPYKFRHKDQSASEDKLWPEGFDNDFIRATAETSGLTGVMLTRPMTFAKDALSRRHAGATAIRTIRIPGLPHDAPALAMLYGSDDCIRWTPLRRFDPRRESHVLTPPRLFWRMLLYGEQASRPAAFSLAIEVTLNRR